VIWDKMRRILSIVNDPFGLEPIILLTGPQGIIFASEVKALLQAPHLDRRLDWGAVADFFQFGHLLGGETFFEGVELLPPASLVVYERSKLSRGRYWTLSHPDNYERKSCRDYNDRIYDVLFRAVERSFLPGERCGVSLTGGMDSRWILACLTAVGAETRAFTYSKKTSDDLRIAKEVAEAVGVPHTTLPMPEDYLIRYADAIIYITDGMFSIVHAHVFPFVWDLADRVDVVLSGCGGDGLFGSRAFRGTLGKSQVAKEQALDFLWYGSIKHGLPSELMGELFGDRTHNRLRERARQSLKDSLADCAAAYPADAMAHWYQYNRLRRFLYGSELIKKPFVENRCPFMDKAVIEAVLELSPWQRFHEQAYCRALRVHFPNVASIPWEKTGLPASTPLLPLLLYERGRKTVCAIGRRLASPRDETQRLYASYGVWMRGPLREYVCDTLLGDGSNELGIFRRQGIRQILDIHMSGRADFREFIGLMLTFERWSRMFFRSPQPTPPGSLVPAGYS
jgi:asparagine synthase (glutamine-hydrolysing)